MRQHAARWVTAGMLALVLGGCDNDKVSVVEEGEQSEDLKAFLESPPRTNVSGAHRQSDPHASLSADKMAQVALQHFDEGRPELAVETLNEAVHGLLHGLSGKAVHQIGVHVDSGVGEAARSLRIRSRLTLIAAVCYSRPRNTTSRWPISIAASSSNPPYPRLISIAHRPTKLWGSVTRRLATLNIS